MTATLDTTPTGAPDIAKMTRHQKLAGLLIVLGPESAAEIIKGLDPQEVTAVTAAMTAMPVIDAALQRHILREFSDVAVNATTALRGGVEFAQSTLEKAVGPSQARQILSRIAPGQSADSPMHALVEKDARQLFNCLKSEQPQTIALVLSFLDTKKASDILNLLDPDPRSMVVERLATLGPIPVNVVEAVAKSLLQRIGAITAPAFNQTGGVDPAAGILKTMHKDATNQLLAAIEQRDPALSDAIRKRIFTFADVSKLAIPDLQKILREVDQRTLAMALRGADDTTKRRILAGLSKRAAESIEEEIGFLGKLKPKEIELAQLAVIDIVRRLEAEGQIEIPQDDNG